MQVRCYGVIPLRSTSNGWEVLLIQHRNGGHWAFPKGHAEAGEAALDVAKRELEEETGLTMSRLLHSEMLEESYSYREKDSEIQKTVGYFLAEVEGSLTLQEEEILDGGWLSSEEAFQRLTFPEATRVLKAAFSRL